MRLGGLHLGGLLLVDWPLSNLLRVDLLGANLLRKVVRCVGRPPVGRLGPRWLVAGPHRLSRPVPSRCLERKYFWLYRPVSRRPVRWHHVAGSLPVHFLGVRLQGFAIERDLGRADPVQTNVLRTAHGLEFCQVVQIHHGVGQTQDSPSYVNSARSWHGMCSCGVCGLWPPNQHSQTTESGAWRQSKWTSWSSKADVH